MMTLKDFIISCALAIYNSFDAEKESSDSETKQSKVKDDPDKDPDQNVP